jgi:hypothetical protein
MVYNGKLTREWLSREDSMSPTVSLESLFITRVINAKEGRDVMTADIPSLASRLSIIDSHWNLAC